MSNIIETAAQAFGWAAKQKGNRVALRRGKSRDGIELRVSAETANRCFVQPFRDQQAKDAAEAKRQAARQKQSAERAAQIVELVEAAKGGPLSERAIELAASIGRVTPADEALLDSLMSVEEQERFADETQAELERILDKPAEERTKAEVRLLQLLGE